jgi:hypothetical protein
MIWLSVYLMICLFDYLMFSFWELLIIDKKSKVDVIAVLNQVQNDRPAIARNCFQSIAGQARNDTVSYFYVTY